MESLVPKPEPPEEKEPQDSSSGDKLPEELVALNKVSISNQQLPSKIVQTAKMSTQLSKQNHWLITSNGRFEERDLTPVVGPWRNIQHPAKIVFEASTFWISDPNVQQPPVGHSTANFHMHTFGVDPSCITITRHGSEFLLQEFRNPGVQYGITLLDEQNILDLKRKLWVLGFNLS